MGDIEYMMDRVNDTIRAVGNTTIKMCHRTGLGYCLRVNNKHDYYLAVGILHGLGHNYEMFFTIIFYDY